MPPTMMPLLDVGPLELPNGLRVRAIRVIGRGEFGSVYLGELGLRYVVIKILKVQVGIQGIKNTQGKKKKREQAAFLQSQTEADFLSECELHASTNHPNIVGFVCSGRRGRAADGLFGNEPFCVLDYAGDRTLRCGTDFSPFCRAHLFD